MRPVKRKRSCQQRLGSEPQSQPEKISLRQKTITWKLVQKPGFRAYVIVKKKLTVILEVKSKSNCDWWEILMSFISILLNEVVFEFIWYVFFQCYMIVGKSTTWIVNLITPLGYPHWNRYIIMLSWITILLVTTIRTASLMPWRKN